MAEHRGETFGRVQAILERNGHTSFRSSNKRQPFGTVARCQCGQLLTPHAGGSGYSYYRCSKGNLRDGHAYAAAELVEAIVAGVLIASESVLRGFLADESWRKLGATAADVEQLAADLATVEEQAEQLAGMIALGGIAGRKATERADFLNARHAELTEQHEEATRDAETLRADLDRLHVALTFGGAYDDPDFMDGYRVLNFWRTATVEEKRSTLEAILSRIELAPDRMTFTYRHSLRGRIAVSLPTRRRDKETARLKAMGLGLDKEPQGDSLGQMEAIR